MNSHERMEAAELAQIIARSERRRAESSEPRERMRAMAVALSEPTNHDEEPEQDHGGEMLAHVFAFGVAVFLVLAACWWLWRAFGGAS